MEGEDGALDFEFRALELSFHSIGDGEVCVSDSSTEPDLVDFVEGNEDLEHGLLAEDSVAVVVPVDYEFASANEGDEESDVKRGDRGGVLFCQSHIL